MKLPLSKTIGIIGGGQLGKMLIEASRPWNFNYHILEGSKHCPAGHLAAKVIEGSLQDADKIRELAENSDVITYEIEHINSDVLVELEEQGKLIIPSPKALQVIQDKGVQKQFYSNNQIKTAPYYVVNNKEDWAIALSNISGDKLAVKLCKGGYDGKGVALVNREELEKGNYPFDAPCMVEKYIPNVKELAIIVAQDQQGNRSLFPEVEMFFNPTSNLVEFLFSPSTFSKEVIEEAKNLALKVIQGFNTPGLFAVELFVDQNNQVWVNETAPRPHNSGHHTIEGCYTSQYEQLNRILAGYPLGETALLQPSAMINITGPEGFSGAYILDNLDELLKTSGVYVHLYKKAESKPHRKLGHVTVLATDLDSLLSKAEQVKEMIKIIPA
jgi:5-(carboxyamino)imidazole ribonucleotide synthase